MTLHRDVLLSAHHPIVTAARQLFLKLPDPADFLPWLVPVWLVWRRIRERLLLLLATLAGLLTAVTLLATIPLYSDAAGERLLHQQLARRASNGQLAVAYRHTASQPGPLDPDRHRSLDALLRAQASSWLGLPTVTTISAGESASQALKVFRNERFEDIRGMVTQGYVGYRHDLLNQIEVAEGRLPAAELTSEGEIEALISHEANDQLPLGVESRVLLHDPAQAEQQKPPIKVRVVGVFRPRDENALFWYGMPDTYQRRIGFFVQEEAFRRHVMTADQPFGSSLSWYFLFPEKEISSATADHVVNGIEFIATQINMVLSPTMVDRSIYAAFEGYRAQVGQLRLLLLVFAIPVIAIVLYYMSMATRLLIESQRGEIAVLRSRGAKDGQIVSLVTADVVCMVAVAMVLGPLLGMLLARLIGAAYGFLLFASNVSLPVRFSSDTPTYGLLGAALALATVVGAAMSASRGGIVAHAQAVGRLHRSPWWQRFFLDLLLLGIAAYGYDRLQKTGGLLLYASAPADERPFIEPLTLIVPVVFLAGCGMFVARLLPILVAILAWVAGRLPNVSLAMALRQIARAPGHHTGLVLLLVWTVGLGSFSAAVARTLDRRAVDQAYYEVGADVRLSEQGWYDSEREMLVYPPIEDHLNTPGVLGATPVVMVPLRQQTVPPASLIRVVGIDRVTFPTASWFREDFAARSLGEMMNWLAVNPSGVLVERKFAEAAQLQSGSELILSSQTGNAPIAFVVVGIVDYFPTLYPTEGPFVIANLSYLEEEVGLLPHDVWLSVDERTPLAQIQADLQERGYRIVDSADARLLVQRQKQDPLRVGVFGLLSVGFVAGFILTVLGFVVHTILSFKRRATELGLLRVLGLSPRQLGFMLTVEHLFVVGSGIVAGSVAGLFANALFAPFMLTTEVGKRAGIPPMLPVSPTDDLAKLWLALTIIVILTIPTLIVILARRRLAEGLRLGESEA